MRRQGGRGDADDQALGGCKLTIRCEHEGHCSQARIGVYGCSGGSFRAHHLTLLKARARGLGLGF